ncbi:MAG: 4-hydroxybutyrate dehydrogenase [Defluviitaleaceae bacterium]|nr:4-hydroxybutyrate dehydrogenase [Defluviitaleaceae bacterium]
MRQLMLKPLIYQYGNCKDFVNEFNVGKGDLIITNEFIYAPFFGEMNLSCDVLFQERYGKGEPSDEMVDAIYKDIKAKGDFKRIIAVGGGTVLDIAKLFALENVSPAIDLFDRKLEIVKDKQLVLIPTTCGTGSEVTNISILKLESRKTKLGLSVDELFADSAVMIPELLESLPFQFFAASSIDALIHATESVLSPKATPFTELFGYKAIEIIIRGYQEITRNGESARIPLLGDFLLASCYAGISFSNAGCAAVHAMSYPLGGKYNVPHGEANYTMFINVFKHYMAISSEGSIAKLNKHLASLLDCGIGDVYDSLSVLLGKILPLKSLSEYGVTAEDIDVFTDIVMEKQGRLMANNFVKLDAKEVKAIYEELL